MKPEILFLKQEDVIKAGVLDMPMILEEAERTLGMWARDEIINPTKVGMVLPDPENEKSFFIAMPAYISEEDVAGFKWAAESRTNGPENNLPRGIDILMLSDPNTVLPVAIMEASIITAMRTAASAGVGAKYLTGKKTKRACLIGAGIIGRTMVMAISNAVPGLEEIEIYDLDSEKARKMAAEFEGKIKVNPVSELEPAVRRADLVVTMTSARTPFVKKEWIKNDATVIQMGPNDLEPDVILGADTLIVDNWQQLTHSKISAIHHLFERGEISESDVTELRYVVNGDKIGRKNEEEQVVYCSLGLGAMDMVIANRLYKNAKADGIGQIISLWDEPLWV